MVQQGPHTPLSRCGIFPKTIGERSPQFICHLHTQPEAFNDVRSEFNVHLQSPRAALRKRHICVRNSRMNLTRSRGCDGIFVPQRPSAFQCRKFCIERRIRTVGVVHSIYFSAESLGQHLRPETDAEIREICAHPLTHGIDLQLLSRRTMTSSNTQRRAHHDEQVRIGQFD